jgi:glutamine synthetase
MVLKYVIKKQAQLNGKKATFMPKPMRDDFGSGMHTYFSFWKGADPLFAGNSYAGLSDIGVGAIGGLLRHAPSLLALTNPSTNSYKRLVMQYDAPVFLSYSQRNRGTAVRIPMYSSSPKTKQIEFRCPDASSNPYLALSAILMAALDGVQNKIHPGEPLDQNLRNISVDRRRELPQTPTSLASSLSALEIDHDFLVRGDVFSPELIESWIDCKRTMEIDMVRSCPHPKEFELYFDV